MARIIFLLVCLVAISSNSVALEDNLSPDDSKKTAKDAFEQNDLVPQFVPTGPNATIDVVYVDANATAHYVKNGNQLEVENTLQEPVVSWDADKNALYSLIMFDADAPTPETSSTCSPFLHWLIINIPDNSIEKGEASAPYLTPSPMPGPAHRYVFVLYKQTGNVTNDFKDSLVRSKFPIVSFTGDHNMTGPVAGNFFKEQTIATPSAPSLKQLEENKKTVSYF